MRCKTAQVFLMVSLLFLLGHQLVPHLHQHQPEKPGISMQQAGHSDWLSRIFGLDQGADHLEHFRLNTLKNVVSPAPDAAFLAVIVRQLLLPPAIQAKQQATSLPEYLRSGPQQRRGPPMV
jgi:hypothetical protein